VEHRATLLPDGRVLVTGGMGSEGSQDSVEVWDPETDSFSPAGTLAVGRAEHTSTLLPDRRVLIVGGKRKSQYPAGTAEIWDPETTSFGPADLFTADRLFHTATLLRDGRVLIVGGGEGGGSGNGIAEPPAEVWDPATGSSVPAGSLAEGRMAHTATLLSDGRVLIVGGDTDQTGERPATTAEVWDPATATFGPAGSLLVGTRPGHSATLLSDGRVLVVGGDAGCEKNDCTAHASAEIWDPVTASRCRRQRMR